MHWLTGVIGLAFTISPFVLGYANDASALLSSVVLGLGVLIVSAIKGFIPDKTRWEYIAAGILGVLMIVAPFVLNFSFLAEAVWASVYLGAIVAILSGIQLRKMFPSMVRERVTKEN